MHLKKEPIISPRQLYCTTLSSFTPFDKRYLQNSA